MLRKVDRILLRVEGLAGATHYYRDVLKLELLRKDAHIVSFRLGDGATELILHDDPNLPDQASYLLVDDVRDMYRRRAELKLTFINPPAQAARGFRATAKDPFGSVLLLIDRSTEQAGHNQIEDAKPAESLFAGIEPKISAKRDLLIRLYEQIGRTADDLPYTPHFEKLHSDYAASFPQTKPTRAETWRHLLNIRKGGKLPKMGEARSIPPEISDEDRQRLREALGEDIGKRDRLPYTKRFDELVDTFNKTHPRPISPHLVWRLVATLAK